MKVSRLLSIVIVGLSGALFFAAAAQEVGPRIETPHTASVIAGESQRLVPGQEFSFQLRFDRAPDGYGGGKIQYKFQVQTGQSSKIYQATDGGQTELHDGQAIYSLSLPIKDSMLPGTWKLVEVTLGRSVQKPVSIQEDITFEIPKMTPAAIHVQAPGSARAGERFTVKITLTKYPDFVDKNCALRLSGRLIPASNSPQMLDGADRYGVAMSSIELSPDRREYEISGALISDLPAGPWRGDVSISTDAPNGHSCRSPALEGNVGFTFDLQPAIGLVTPTSVAVTVNPSQIQLLLAEADRLNAKAQEIREHLNSENPAANQVLLQNSLQDVLADLDKTEEAYKEKGVEPSFARAVNIFFDDIRFDYGEALKALANQSAQGSQAGPRLERVRAALGGPFTTRLNRASEKVLASVLHNARAYYLAASSGTLTLNLDVYSDPKGATVSYKQRADPEFTSIDQKTDCQIPGLYRAGYLIRFQKPGYEEQTLPFNGADSDKTSITATLVRKGHK
jgi:hypothetical protein